ncbi:MAG: hypothetical protein ACK4YF_05070 [Exilispira sp.]
MVAFTNLLLDDGFMLLELNDEELSKVEGNAIKVDPYQRIIIENGNDYISITTEVLLVNGSYGLEELVIKDVGNGVLVIEVVKTYDPNTKTYQTYKKTSYYL